MPFELKHKQLGNDCMLILIRGIGVPSTHEIEDIVEDVLTLNSKDSPLIVILDTIDMESLPLGPKEIVKYQDASRKLQQFVSMNYVIVNNPLIKMLSVIASFQKRILFTEARDNVIELVLKDTGDTETAASIENALIQFGYKNPI